MLHYSQGPQMSHKAFLLVQKWIGTEMNDEVELEYQINFQEALC